MDTNDSEAWLKVNDFLTDLRGRAHCILLVHHEGKNGTQRGRTDGLAFKWRYSKVRHGGNLPDFEAACDAVGAGGW